MTKTFAFFPGAAVLALVLLLQSSLPLSGETYYLSVSGDDAAAGTSPETAWKSLGRVNGTDLEAGDLVLLKTGDQFMGSLSLGVPGQVLENIMIGSYGEGPRPLIDGNGEDACIRLVNPSGCAVRGLSLINEDGRYGLRMTAQDAGALRGVTIEDLVISKIYAQAWSERENAAHDEKKYYGGINAQVLRSREPSWWEGIIIRNCELHDLGTCAISIGSDFPLHEQMRSRWGRDPFPIKGVLIHDNVLRDIARDGAIVRQCQGAVMQNNEVIRTGRVSLSNGIWFWDCQDSVIRYNIGSGCGVRADADGGPFSIDYYCKDCVIEYNYSHDNEGPGFMAFGNRGTGTGTIIRGNVSYNDATAEAKPGFAAVSMISTLSETVVEDNLVIAGPDTRVLMGHHDWEGMPRDVVYRGNVFVGNGSAKVEPSVLVGGRFEGNLFLNVPELPGELQEISRGAPWDFIEVMRQRSGVIGQAGRRPSGPEE